MRCSPCWVVSLMALLKKLGTFTSPSLRTFAALVTGMLTAAGLSRAWSHDQAHAFFSRESWNVEVLGLALSHLVVRSMLPTPAATRTPSHPHQSPRRGPSA